MTPRPDRDHTHPYDADAGIPADPLTGAQPCRCGLPGPNAVHAVPDTAEQQDEHRRRAGERDD